MYQSLSFQITGVSPLLMHNGRLADPLDPLVKDIKKLSCKRPKTEADLERITKSLSSSARCTCMVAHRRE
ncbi:hypothetical protein [Azospirillum largimobile]